MNIKALFTISLVVLATILSALIPGVVVSTVARPRPGVPELLNIRNGADTEVPSFGLITDRVAQFKSGGGRKEGVFNSQRAGIYNTRNINQIEPLCQVDIYPPRPMTNDVIQITPFGVWSDSCGPDYQSHQVTGNVIRIDAEANPPGIACAPAMMPWEFTVEVGPLLTGTYTIQVYVAVWGGSPILYNSTSFTVIPAFISKTIPESGGELTYHYPGHTTSLAVPPGALSASSVFTIGYHKPPTTTGQLQGMDHFFDLDGGQTIFTVPLTLTTIYSESERRPIIPGTEGLYWWRNSQWVTDGLTLTSRWADGLSVQITHLSLFGVLGETNRVYLPIILKDYPGPLCWYACP